MFYGYLCLVYTGHWTAYFLDSSTPSVASPVRKLSDRSVGYIHFQMRELLLLLPVISSCFSFIVTVLIMLALLAVYKSKTGHRSPQFLALCLKCTNRYMGHVLSRWIRQWHLAPYPSLGPGHPFNHSSSHVTVLNVQHMSLLVNWHKFVLWLVVGRGGGVGLQNRKEWAQTSISAAWLEIGHPH